MNGYDRTASAYDGARSLPRGVPEAVRAAFLNAVETSGGRRVLEVGAGTGRVGMAFVAGGDDYIGVDNSGRMLARFAEKAAALGGRPVRLVRADGRDLPFPRGAFDGVLMVQVLSGIRGWTRVVEEAIRVLGPGGVLGMGQTVRPEDGVDARLRGRLVAILGELGWDARPPGAGREEVRARLGMLAAGSARAVAASWPAICRPRDFLARKPTGARFAALPPQLADEALGRLAGWAEAEFGGLDTSTVEPHRFEIDMFTFGTAAAAAQCSSSGSREQRP